MVAFHIISTVFQSYNIGQFTCMCSLVSLISINFSTLSTSQLETDIEILFTETFETLLGFESVKHGFPAIHCTS